MPERYRPKMQEFVDKLLTQPALAGASVIQKENQVLGFVKENGAQLKVAFGQPDFFPDIEYDAAIRLLLTIMTESLVAELEPLVDSALKSPLGPEVSAYFRDQGNLDLAGLRTFVMAQLRNKAMRDQYAYCLIAFQAGFFERYVPGILARRKYIYNEMIRRDRLNMDHSLIPEYLRLAALVRPLYWYKFTTAGGAQASLADRVKNSSSFATAYEELEKMLKEEVGDIPEGIVRPAIESCLSTADFPDKSGTSRLLQIIVSRAGDYVPGQKVDKGAESPDKSWFNIHRRNAKFYGFDGQFLDELYRTAGEEGW